MEISTRDTVPNCLLKFKYSGLANLRMNENAECIKFCDRALEKKPDSVKALYRKGQVIGLKFIRTTNRNKNRLCSSEKTMRVRVIVKLFVRKL